MAVPKWQNLHCLACQGETFYSLLTLRHHPTGGLTQEPVGLRCSACHNDANPSQMLARQRRQALLAELQAMEAEAAQDAAALGSSDSLNGSPTTRQAASSKSLSI